MIEGHKCIGCGECILVCPHGAVQVQWNESAGPFPEKDGGACGRGPEREGGQVGLPQLPHADKPRLRLLPEQRRALRAGYRDPRVLDPVAIDAASVDLVNAQDALPGTALKRRGGAGQDKFRALYPDVDWNVQLDHAVKMGLGGREYRIVKV